MVIYRLVYTWSAPAKDSKRAIYSIIQTVQLRLLLKRGSIHREYVHPAARMCRRLTNCSDPEKVVKLRAAFQHKSISLFIL